VVEPKHAVVEPKYAVVEPKMMRREIVLAVSYKSSFPFRLFFFPILLPLTLVKGLPPREKWVDILKVTAKSHVSRFSSQFSSKDLVADHSTTVL
jgi:hypothetical protein